MSMGEVVVIVDMEAIIDGDMGVGGSRVGNILWEEEEDTSQDRCGDVVLKKSWAARRRSALHAHTITFLKAGRAPIVGMAHHRPRACTLHPQSPPALERQWLFALWRPPSSVSDQPSSTLDRPASSTRPDQDSDPGLTQA